MVDVYGEEKAQRLADEVWLRDAGENDWIVLTKDDAIRRRPAERDALTAAAVRAFCLTAGHLRGAEQIERFVGNRHRILKQARSKALHLRRLREWVEAIVALRHLDHR